MDHQEKTKEALATESLKMIASLVSCDFSVEFLSNSLFINFDEIGFKCLHYAHDGTVKGISMAIHEAWNNQATLKE